MEYLLGKRNVHEIMRFHIRIIKSCEDKGVFILAGFIRSVKNEGLIPESFVEISSSSLDFHKNGVPDYALPDLKGSMKAKHKKADFRKNRFYVNC